MDRDAIELFRFSHYETIGGTFCMEGVLYCAHLLHAGESAHKELEKLKGTQMSAHELPKIETGIPIPKKINPRPKWKFIIDMKEGESFMVDTAKERNTALRVADWHGVNIVTRKIDGVGYRIWRVKGTNDHGARES